ncbi:MAG: carboxypeptidase-like regulatory domain-containing protein [Pseudomonadota bacterium]
MKINRLLNIAWSALLLGLLAAPAVGQIAPVSLELISSDRVDRFNFEYEYRLRVTNEGAQNASSVTATISTDSVYLTLVDDGASFGPVGAGDTVASTDTFRVRHNRRGPFNEDDLSYQFDAVLEPLLSVTIETPAPFTTVGGSPLEVTGTVQPEDAELTVNGESVVPSGGTFSTQVELSEGENIILARVMAGEMQVTDSLSVTLDTTPPAVTIDSHSEGGEVFTDTITVTGAVTDIVRGSSPQEETSVTVNGVAASVANSSYSASVPLVLGQNTITATATDLVGNVAARTITLIYSEPTGGQLVAESGDGQSAMIRQALAAPLVVRLTDAQAQPVPNETVVFRVTQGSGTVQTGLSGEERAVMATTDADGRASVNFTLGERAGTANQKVRAQVVGFPTQVVFTASALPRLGNKVSISTGNNQVGATGERLPLPLVVLITDSGANDVAGARVLFEASAGGGTFDNGASSQTVVTDMDGRAAVRLTLGTLSGRDAQRVTATLLDAENANAPPRAGFTASAFDAGPVSETTVVGVVLDNQDEPLEGVTVSIEGTERQDVTGADGQFRITEVPAGSVHVVADGSTIPGEDTYPNLSFPLVTIAGAQNELPAPIYMVRLDTDNAVFAGPEDVSLTLPRFPGFRLDIAANSVTFPDGSREGLVSVTPVNTAAVPMPPPDGMQPRFIITIQPSDTIFDPPARLTLPNFEGYEPGAQVEMFSFDHDLEAFVSIGLGTVSENGAEISSNVGVGVVKAGWHCGSQPGGSGCTNDCAECQQCDDNCVCQPDDSQMPESRCKECMGGEAVNKADGTMPDPDNMCILCMGGEEEEVSLGDWMAQAGSTFEFPAIFENEYETKINLIPGVMVNLTPSVSVNSGRIRDCCNKDTGELVTGGNVESSGSGMLTGSASASIFPPGGGLNQWDFEVELFDAFGVEVEIEAAGRVGVFLTAAFNFSGEVGFRTDTCNSEQCGFGNIGGNVTLDLAPTIQATACLEIEVFGDESENCLPELEITPIGLQGSIGGSLSFNGNSCDSGLSGEITLGQILLRAEVTIPGYGPFIGFEFVIFEGF